MKYSPEQLLVLEQEFQERKSAAQKVTRKLASITADAKHRCKASGLEGPVVESTGDESQIHRHFVAAQRGLPRHHIGVSIRDTKVI